MTARPPFWLLEGDYVYMKGNTELDNNHAHQITATVSSYLSKKTLVYVQGANQRASSGARAQINYVFTGSSTSAQAIARVGMKLVF